MTPTRTDPPPPRSLGISTLALPTPAPHVYIDMSSFHQARQCTANQRSEIWKGRHEYRHHTEARKITSIVQHLFSFTHHTRDRLEPEKCIVYVLRNRKKTIDRHTRTRQAKTSNTGKYSCRYRKWWLKLKTLPSTYGPTDESSCVSGKKIRSLKLPYPCPCPI